MTVLVFISHPNNAKSIVAWSSALRDDQENVEYRRLREQKISRGSEQVRKLRTELEALMAEFRAAMRRWEELTASVRVQPALARAR